MPDRPIPKHLQRALKVNTVEEMWHKILTEGNTRWRQGRHVFGMIPSNPRCVNCHRPFGGIGGALLHVIQGTHKSTKNPRFCAACHSFTTQFPGGAEIELTMLFVDVRGSTTLAEKMNDAEFSHLMNRFYEATINVLVQADAFIDKLVGDEVTALFIPGFAGKEHARRAIEAGQALLRVTGYEEPGGPWIPVGVGIHTGTAWVGSIVGASGAAADFTALGDNVNIAARLASKAGAGEVLISEAAYHAAQIEIESLEKRELELKGKSELVSVRVLHAG
ncbi:MAG TPA: adenylate/guanylate cyclase domain-containing protein [Anaerolineales bacterium]|nr:adenylate/guanylate cyclase domain-containing protein [Anaerolineales bacterium]